MTAADSGDEFNDEVSFIREIPLAFIVCSLTRLAELYRRY